MKKIITVQHCQAVHHLNQMVGGVTDWELTELGFKQAENIGIALKEKIGVNSDYKIYSSDLLRTRQTADTIAKHLNITPIYCKYLREINLGSATASRRNGSRQIKYLAPVICRGFIIK